VQGLEHGALAQHLKHGLDHFPQARSASRVGDLFSIHDAIVPTALPRRFAPVSVRAARDRQG
jgi:hypothetical protein